MQIVKINPIHKVVKRDNNVFRLAAGYSMHDTMKYGINSISDYNFKTLEDLVYFYMTKKTYQMF